MASAKLLRGGVRLMRFTLGIHIMSAKIARTDQMAREPFHPRLSWLAKGKLSPAATAAPNDIIPEYKLVTKPALCGKFRLISAGISTFPKAIDRKSTRLNSSHVRISYAVFCLKKKKINK